MLVLQHQVKTLHIGYSLMVTNIRRYKAVWSAVSGQLDAIRDATGV